MKFPIYKQLYQKDCGPACVKIISMHYGKNISIENIRKLCETNRQGSNLKNIARASEEVGFRTLPVKIRLSKLKTAQLPCILHWNKTHFLVLYSIKGKKYYVSDPEQGLVEFTENDFIYYWTGQIADSDSDEGVVLLIEPRPDFNSKNFAENDDCTEKPKKSMLDFLWSYVKSYRAQLRQLSFGLIGAILLQLTLPFLTQSLIDIGIKNHDLSFVYLILFAQIFVFAGRTIIEALRSWILLYLSTRVSVSLISDFFYKLMQLPISYFDTKLTGDIMQRIRDHKRIETLLTDSIIEISFSSVTIVVFSAVLFFYSPTIFLVFLCSILLFFIWILFFLKKRRQLDYKKFHLLGKENNKIIELIRGMKTIKLHNAEQNKRWEWENIQAKLFNVSVSSLRLKQFQDIGSSAILEMTSIIITVISAKLVIQGEITLGMMLAISFIIGQTMQPIHEFLFFIQDLQDAKISVDRLNEIHNYEVKENINDFSVEINHTEGIRTENLTFRYPNTQTNVLENITLTIPYQRSTAIVGYSGSGKTTLLKLLLKFYELQTGTIHIGNKNLRSISNRKWRELSGVVLQEDTLFNDTISGNIAMSGEAIDFGRIEQSCKAANIYDFVMNLPWGYDTIIGTEGLGLSTGQKQRILLARIIYKNPEYIFLDEATSALDSENERIIMSNLNTFLKGKTSIIIAHRLSTVRNADNILVLDKGKIVENGTHEELIKRKGQYFKLIQNQLELGK